MSELTAEDMLEIAKDVYPALVDVNKNEILIFQGGQWSVFSPSLTGTAQQRLQALDCIVAATKLTWSVHLYQYDGTYEFIIHAPDVESRRTDWQPDILTAALLALRANK